MKFTFSTFLLLFVTVSYAQQLTDLEYGALVEKSAFNEMYPKVVAEDSAEYFAAWNKLFSEGPIATKEARLAAISASAAMKYEYCIAAQIHLAKEAGASEDEIKTAIQIAAEVARFSVLLYGNEFDVQKFNEIVGIEK